jgi:L-seryl-tRNA(Ser) seleniumtransferase
MAGKVIATPRDFPSVEELLQSGELSAAISAVPRPVAARIVKGIVAELKQKLVTSTRPLSTSVLISTVRKELASASVAAIGRVINATGILVHTNLGRAPLSASIFDAVKQSITG